MNCELNASYSALRKLIPENDKNIKYWKKN